MKKLTREEFIRRGKEIYGDKYNYDYVIFNNTITKVKLFCNKCNEFFYQIPYSHLKGYSCSKCAAIYRSKKRKTTKEVFTRKAIKIHGDKYGYEHVVLENMKTKVKLFCNKCNDFFNQTPDSHLRGCGCPKCGIDTRSKKKRLTRGEFIKRGIKKHGNSNNYDFVIYTNFDTEVKLFCNECNNFYYQTPKKHLSGIACMKCYQSKLNKKGEFIKRATKKHGEKYSYFDIDLSFPRLKIFCKKCNEFFYQTSNGHLSGRGCLKCGGSKKMTTDEFIKIALEINSDSFNYDYIVYKNARTNVKILCNECDSFFYQRPDVHLFKRGGCSLCSKQKNTSIEKIIKEILDKHNIEYVQNTKKIITPKELDFYIPSHNLAIECSGLYWHGELRLNDFKINHLNKLNSCIEKNIKLINFFGDEILFKTDLVESIILNNLGLNSKKIFGRKCNLKLIENKIAKDFIKKNHIHGAKVVGKYNVGIFYDDTIFGVLSIGKSRFDKKVDYEIIRYCTLRGVNILGGFSKSLKYFIKNISEIENPKIISYVDKRLFDGRSYEKCGFEFVSESKPGFFYSDGTNKFNRVMFQKHKLKNKINNFNPNLTGHQNMLNNGYFRIYDCGTKKYLYYNSPENNPGDNI